MSMYDSPIRGIYFHYYITVLYKEEEKIISKTTTKKDILDSAKKNFLEKGFQQASLRQIVKDSGVTTGAFYGYFSSKEELFDSLVDDAFNYLIDEFKAIVNRFEQLSPYEQEVNMSTFSREWLIDAIDYIYNHFDEFRLLLCCAEGTKYANFIHDLVVLEVDSTEHFIKTLQANGQEVPSLDPVLEHLLTSGMFSSFFEIVIHNYPKEYAKNCINELFVFYSAGWTAIMKLE